MALIEMKKLNLIGLNSERERIMDALFRTGNAEVARSEDIENTVFISDPKRRESYLERLNSLDFAIDFIDTLRTNKSTQKLYLATEGKKGKVERKVPLVSLEEFTAVSTMEIELMAKIDELKEINRKLAVNNAEISKLNVLAEQLVPYLSGEYAFSDIKDSKNVFMLLGTVSADSAETLKDKISANGNLSAETERAEKTGFAAVLVTGLKEFRQEADFILSEFSFVKCPFDFEVTAQEKTEEIRNKTEELEKNNTELLISTLDYYNYVNDWKLLYDYYTFKLRKSDAESECHKTKSAFIMEAWVPADMTEIVKNEVMTETLNVYMEFTDPAENDEPPTATRNNKIVKQFEFVTNMYTPPAYGEIDPNGFLSFFFFVFFGLMLADAGYGILLMLATFAILKIMKPQRGMRQLCWVILFGGLSTFIWGALFGGWFGLDLVPQVKIFTPLENPMLLIGICLVLGIIQLITGLAINMAANFKKGDWQAALFDVFPWILIYVAVLMIAAGVIGIEGIPEIVGTIGIYVALFAVAVIILTNGRKKKSVFGKIFGGIPKLYNAINYMSDVLSYLRLFGLGIASGVVAMVFNSIAGLLFNGSFIGYIFGGLILIIGHTFNIAMNCLGAYVHGARLQFIEFFNKFYTGDGRLFTPLGSDLKYNVVKLK